MIKILTDRLERFAPLAELHPVLADVAQLREVHVLWQEMDRHQALSLHVRLHEQGAFYFLSPAGSHRVEQVRYDHGILQPSLILPYLRHCGWVDPDSTAVAAARRSRAVPVG